jgi:hypothetical protein
MMRISYNLTGLVLFLFSFTAVHAQQTSFEGVIDYNTEVISKVKGISDETMKKMFAIAPVMKVHIKNGNYRRENSKIGEFHLKDSSQPFVIFKGIDTVYASSTHNDDSVVIRVKKEDKTAMIAGRACKSIIIKRAKSVSTYFYDPSLYQDPVFNKGNDIGDYSIFLNETSSVYLKVVTEFEYVTLTETAYRIISSKVNDEVFMMPALPITEFKLDSFLKSAEFKSQKDWSNYLQKNMNLELVGKHVKIPKGQTSADQVAEVRFVVQSTGIVSDVEVMNPKDVHPALAKEAIRLIKESYGWKPATVRGEKIDSWAMQKITFRSVIE